MEAPGSVFTIQIVRDWAIEALSFAALCGAVLCAGVVGGVEVMGGVALLARQARLPWMTNQNRPCELRFDGDGWTVFGADGAIAPIEPPIVHVVHRALVVLEVCGTGRSNFLMFSPAATALDDLRRLRLYLRAEGLSR